MKKTIRVNKSGIIEAYAHCSECGWDDAMDIEKRNRMRIIRNRIYSHVKQTGHKVVLETGYATSYELE